MDGRAVIWDRTRRWIIERREVGRGRVEIDFGTTPISIAQMAAIRKTIPELAQARPREIRARVSASGVLQVGEYGYIEANGIAHAALEAGLPAKFINATRVETAIIDEARGTCWMIEDPDEHERIVQEMIAAGAKVEYVAVD